MRDVVSDEAASRFCEGNYVNGTWTLTDPKCKDKVNYKTITARPKYITVRVILPYHDKSGLPQDR